MSWEGSGASPLLFSKEMAEQSNADMAVAIRAFLAKELDDPEIELETGGAGSWKIWQNLKVEDSALGSPFPLGIITQSKQVPAYMGAAA